MRINIKEVLFWVFLIFAIVLLVWNVFGNSPTEFVALIAILFTILLKVISVSERLVKLETRFGFLARDFRGHVKGAI